MFELFLDKYIEEDNISALKLYLLHFKNSIIFNDIKLIKYFGNYILRVYTRLCSKKSNDYLIEITDDILDIISYYNGIELNIIKKIKNRIYYNITHSNIWKTNKNKILLKI